jgi:hypothetical protein
MKGYTLLIAVVLALGWAPSLQATRALDPQKPQEAGGYLPTKLNVLSASFRRNMTSMVWDGEVLRFEETLVGQPPRKENLTPSEERWMKFWKEMDAIAIWKWKAEYIDNKLGDGHSWEVLLEHGDKKVQARGRNMYPAQFERFEEAVLELRRQKRR